MVWIGGSIGGSSLLSNRGASEGCSSSESCMLSSSPLSSGSLSSSPGTRGEGDRSLSSAVLSRSRNPEVDAGDEGDDRCAEDEGLAPGKDRGGNDGGSKKRSSKGPV